MMNRRAMVVCSLLASSLGAWAQGVDSLAPSAVTPKPPPPAVAPLIHGKPAQPKSPRSPEGDKPLNPDKPNLKIRGILLVRSRAEVLEGGETNFTGLVVRDIPFLDKADFFRPIEKQFIGRPLTENAIRDLEDAIILYCRARGKLLVDVILPEQNIEEGVLQLWFLEGRVGKVEVQNEGRKWFKDQFILEHVRLRSGDTLDSNELNEDLGWLNSNPFRQIDATFKPGNKLGATDVELVVDDRLPLRPYMGYENSGTRFTGPDRLLAGLNWGNAFGLDHQLNYQYSTDVQFNLVKAHSMSYIAPLPWHHTLTLFGSYVDAKADFTSVANTTTAEGTSWQASARYTVPLPHLQKYRHELALGFDFKRSNNNLLAGGTNVLQNSDTDVDQFVVGYSGLMPDAWGRSSFGLEFYYSPGGLTSNNKNEAFNKLRTASRADYFYARLNVERVTRLPYDFSWVLRGWAQIANERLLPGEQLALGGYNTIRGYDERVALGDNGWIVSNEIRTRPITLGNLLQLPGGRDELQLLGFFDCGGSEVIDRRTEDGNNPNKTLFSTGVGLRYTISRNFSLRLDYGIPLSEHALNQHTSRAHIGLLLSL